MADLVGTGLAAVPEKMRAAAREGYATATDLADYLVKKGLPFRDAHEAVARAVRHAEAKGCDLADLSLDELAAFAPQVGADVFAVLTLEGSVDSRDHPGGTAPAQVRRAAAAARAALPPE
jgi:argininosuccinate lyase